MFSQTRFCAVAALSLTLLEGASASHLDDTNGVFSNFSFDQVKFKTQTNCSLDKWPEIRKWLDGDAATYTSMPILVANEGNARLELYKESTLIDTVHIYRYSVDELNELLESMG